MIFSDAHIGDLFLSNERPYLKISETECTDLFIRDKKDMGPQEEITEISIDLLCILIHKEEVETWVNAARDFYIPKEDEEQAAS